ncbi:tol-pal system YbgF family protein [Arthrobacter citreus]|uniref:tetratricopeptide repeat protein n=1 Tax=Arthrobacter TaxID=1663 RepID=UPI001264911A|nr:tetratricopeptide repeat protein [Arthrobacter gandavensis]
MLAEKVADNEGCHAAAGFLSAKEKDCAEDVYEETSVVLARIKFLNVAGDSHLALKEISNLLANPLTLTPLQTSDVLIQKAWTLTNLGRFAESSKTIEEIPQFHHASQNVLWYMQAWNSAGASGTSFVEAVKGSQATLCIDHEESDWSKTFFRGWMAYLDNETERAAQIFSSLPQGSEIQSNLNGTKGELALQGKAYSLLELGDYEAAYIALRRLSDAVPAKPTGMRFQTLMAAHTYGRLAAKLNSLSALETVSNARRAAQMSLGIESSALPRLMDTEAELLLASARPAESRALRVVAMELLEEALGATPADNLAHELGLCLVDAYENKNDHALLRLRELVPRMKHTLGPHHEKTIIARYALTSLTDPADPNSINESDFEGLYRDVVKAFGDTHLLSLKTRYGLGRRLYRQGKVGDALSMYVSIERFLPDLPQNLSFRISVLRRIGDSHRDLRDYDEAHKSYAHALESLEVSVGHSQHRKLEIQLDINECLIKRGQYRQAMTFFSETAAKLRAAGFEETSEYLRAVHGYASCLELLGNHRGSAHNYGHLVRLLDEGTAAPELVNIRGQVYEAAAWNNEMCKSPNTAASLYQKALDVLMEAETSPGDDRRITELKHRIRCCQSLTV